LFENHIRGLRSKKAGVLKHSKKQKSPDNGHPKPVRVAALE